MELNDPCQKHDLEPMSVAASFLSVAKHRLLWHLRRDGVVVTLRSATALVLRRLAGRRTSLPQSSAGATSPRPSQPSQAVSLTLNLRPGDRGKTHGRDSTNARLEGLFQGVVLYAGNGRILRSSGSGLQAR